ncbi:heme biosynthesis protein HemY [Varunaivibrio sulfuroxidans]|uniref:HemY protein n=1 Tax=Varunaivibrio sulfuroxidans TaxID=1773489 RepID=A0A4V6NYK7_9PROT|nr:heme biosynthesis HemY N-terminal domain-containing protein [Varunaivibrio sulfuroxidans]TCS64811.1 HemY protein [Varunaivibrio sulfuroxidans]WES29888.1 heme biosynthesis HemY N-terminal domain-containing protein [Varunaivibrio sulfuroxidans]
MVRALFFFFLLAALAVGGVWLADNPGAVSLSWQGWRVDTSFAVLLLALAVFAVVVALGYRVWLFVRRAPGQLGRAYRENRARKGYRALNLGMVAVAAGDGAQARKQAARADSFLDNPPLTVLLKAQAAQLNGDETAAEGFFRVMLDDPQTEYLGIRGLLNQAVRRNDTQGAIALAQRAFRLNPKSDWAGPNLFEHQVRAGDWMGAEETLEGMVRHKLVASTTARHRQAVIAFARACGSPESDDCDTTLKYLDRAFSLDPGFAPAACAYGEALVGAGRVRKAQNVIEKAWAVFPHPALVDIYLRAQALDDPLKKVGAVEKLIGANPDHPESRIASAAIALEAKLWGEARQNLEDLIKEKTEVGGGLSARVCRMMAELEEHEHGDEARAREWLVRASMADPDPAWVCDDCGHVRAEWSAHCPKCQGIDTQSWRAPPGVIHLPGATPAAPHLSGAAVGVKIIDGKNNSSSKGAPAQV